MNKTDFGELSLSLLLLHCFRDLANKPCNLPVNLQVATCYGKVKRLQGLYKALASQARLIALKFTKYSGSHCVHISP